MCIDETTRRVQSTVSAGAIGPGVRAQDTGNRSECVPLLCEQCRCTFKGVRHCSQSSGTQAVSYRLSAKTPGAMAKRSAAMFDHDRAKIR